MRTITFLLFVSIILSLCEFSVCYAEGIDNETLLTEMGQRVERLQKEVKTYRKELRDYKMKQEAVQKAISEDTKKSREAMEILDKFSTKSISFAAYTLTGIALVLSLVNAFFVYHIGSTYKDTRGIIKDTRDKAEKEFKGQLNIFNGRIEKMSSDLSRLGEQFIIAMDNKRRIMDALVITVGEKIRKKVPDRDILGILDDVFKEELDKHEVESFIADLQSRDKEVKERAVWGVEAVGPEKLGGDKTVEILEEVMDDLSQDPEIRLQAQRSVENIKRGIIV